MFARKGFNKALIFAREECARQFDPAGFVDWSIIIVPNN